MAIVLEVSLTLNPGNQIAYLADDTGLIVGTEYVIAGTHLAADTRFTFNGNLDIVLTKQPIAVPTNNYVTPVSINTVPQAAPAPPPATYPYSVKNQLTAGGLNHDMEFSPGAVPPQSALGGAGKFKYWIDTSTTIPSLRQCVVARASTTYVATDWILLGTVDAAAHKFHFNGDVVDFVGGGGISNIFNVTNLNVSGASTLTTLNVTGATTLATLNVIGAATLPTITGPTTLNGALTTNGALTVTGAARLPTITGPTTLANGLTVTSGIVYSGTLGHSVSFGWDGNVHNYIDGTDVGSTVMRIIPSNGLQTAGNTPSGGSVTIGMSGSFAGDFIATGTVNGNGGFTVSGNTAIDGARNFTALNVSAAGTITAGQFTSSGNINASGTISTVGSVVGGTVTSTGRVNASNGNMFMGDGGSGRQLQMASGWYWEWNAGNGDLIWGGPSGASFWVVRYSDRYCGNQIGPVFGNGAYINFSDVRGKTDIAPANQGLAEILKLKPVTFKRVDHDRAELGFTAQDVQEVIPEAVWPLGDADFGVSLDPIVATLVSAVQQLVARLEALERTS